MEERRGVPFSERVTSASWLAEAHAWIGDRTRGLGLRVLGVPEQIRVRPWSTQMVIVTDQGRLWFKAGCRSAAHEPGVQSILAGLAPEHVEAPLAIDAGRGWMLTRDAGPTLQATRAPTEADWRTLIVDAVDVQRRVLADGVSERLRAAGLPWNEPTGVIDRLHDLLRRTRAHQRGRTPQVLSAADEGRILALAPRIQRAARDLRDGPFPTTFVHGDLHPNNVFAGDLTPAPQAASGAAATEPRAVGTPTGSQGSARNSTGPRMFDLGDAMWANALQLLCVPLRFAGDALHPALEQAFLDAWDNPIGRADLMPLLESARLVDTVDRALTWAGALDEVTDAEWTHWVPRSDEMLPASLRPWL